MKLKKLLTKSLLVAGMLAGATSAWAGTSNIFSQASWVHVHDGGSGDRSSSLAFDGTSSIDDNWTACFDVITSSTNSRTNGARNYQIALLSASASSFPSNAVASANVLLGAHFATTNNTDYSSFDCTITVNDVAEAGTVTLTHGTKYTFSVSVNGTAMTVSIKNGATSVFSKAITLDAFVKPKGIYDLLPRPYNSTWGVYTNTYSDILVTKEVNVEEVTTPSIAVAYNGANRTVTITPGESSESNAVTTYYTTDGEDPTSSSSVYSSPLDIDADCTVKAISISSASVASAIASQSLTVGKLKLTTPTFTKTSYADGKYIVSMTSNQSGLAYPPASTIHYYSIDGGDAEAYSAPFELNVGSTVTGYVSATNYTNSDEANTSAAARPVLAEVWSIDFSGQATADKGTVTVGDEAFTANGVSFGNISGDFTSNVNFGVKTGTSWLLRNTGSTGLYSFNGSGTPVGVQGLTAGQYIKMVVADMTSFSVSGGASLVDNMSTTTEKYIIADGTGNANINFNRYGYIKSIGVYDVVSTVSATIPSSTYGTIASAYALDCANLPSGVTAYKVSALSASAATLEEVTTAVAAGTGLILSGDAGTYSIPVVATGTDISATNKLQAAVTATAIAANEAYILKDGQFHLVNAASTVPAGKAYLLASDIAGARTLDFVFAGEETTAISEECIVKNEEFATAPVYNLNGQRVEKATKGLYIVNGKKVVVK